MHGENLESVHLTLAQSDHLQHTKPHSNSEQYFQVFQINQKVNTWLTELNMRFQTAHPKCEEWAVIYAAMNQQCARLQQCMCFTDGSGPAPSFCCVSQSWNHTPPPPPPPWHPHSAPLMFTVLRNPQTRCIMWDHKSPHRFRNLLFSTKLTVRISFICWITQTLSSAEVCLEVINTNIWALYSSLY